MLRLLNCSDRDRVLQYILDHEIELVMVYGNVLIFGLENQPGIMRCADYYGYFDGDELKGFIAFYNMGSCIPHYSDDRAIPFFVELMKDRQFEVVLGMKHIIQPVIDALTPAKPYKSIDEEMYMTNPQHRPYTNDHLTIVEPNADDDEQLAFFVRAAKECFNEVTTPEKERESIRRKPRDEELLIACLEGKSISQALVHGYTPHYGQIGGVATLLAYRGMGAAKTVVSRICECIIKKKCIPTLFVRKNNTPAVKAYEALGFQNFGDYLMVWY
jgi:predicted GNAT family acetyltransferase